jgi:DNA modification methylase
LDIRGVTWGRVVSLEKWLNKVICGDCLEVMGELPDNYIDLTVTSPPYDNLRTYNGFSFDFEGIAKELFRVTKQGGVVVWVIGDSVVRGSETGNAFRQALHFKEIGFNLHDTMIYQKNAFPFPDKTRYAQVFEYMFVLSKGKPNTTNIIRVPTKEANRIKNKKSYQRLPNGETVPMKYETGKSERNKENVWMFEVGYMKTTKDKFAFQHPAMFPEQLAHDHIISWSNEGDIVFDPMCGSGTTCKMAKQLGRNFIGIDISEEYCEIAKQRINAESVNR